MIICRAWSGCVGGQCAVQANGSGICEFAAVVLAVHVSLRIRLSSTADDLYEERKKREEVKIIFS